MFGSVAATTLLSSRHQRRRCSGGARCTSSVRPTSGSLAAMTALESVQSHHHHCNVAKVGQPMFGNLPAVPDCCCRRRRRHCKRVPSERLTPGSYAGKNHHHHCRRRNCTPSERLMSGSRAVTTWTSCRRLCHRQCNFATFAVQVLFGSPAAMGAPSGCRLHRCRCGWLGYCQLAQTAAGGCYRSAGLAQTLSGRAASTMVLGGCRRCH
eukprot:355909-Chlamydomonas_euryale.AAC.3